MLPRAFLCLLLGVASAAAAIDFTPVVSELTSEGFTYRTVTLKQDRAPVTFVAPLGWTVRGNTAALQMTPPKTEFAEASIQAAPLTSPVFDEPVVAALERNALANVPPTSQGAKVESKRENAVVFGHRLSYEIVISYATLGETFHRSFVFVNLDDTRLVFRLSAKKADFEKVYDAFRRSITSWQFLPGKSSSAKAPVNAALQ